MSSEAVEHDGAGTAARELLARDHRVERHLIWKGLVAAAVTVALALARQWWWT